MKPDQAPASFVDTAGRVWDLKIKFGHLRALKQHDIDLLDPPEAIISVGRLLGNEPEKLVEVVYWLCGGQYPDVTPEAFGMALEGRTLWDMSCALSRAVCDFFPIPSVRARLLTLLAESINSPAERTPDSSSEPSSRPPASSESTPTVTPSAN